MKKLQFQTKIHAPVAHVYTIMLGIGDKTTYEAWAAEFQPTSTYDGSWEPGSKIRFIGVDQQGEQGGIIAEIVANDPNRFVSLKTCGFLSKGVEITEGPEVEEWIGGLENYTFREENEYTMVTVDIDVVDDFVDYFNTTWPKALVKLKTICE